METTEEIKCALMWFKSNGFDAYSDGESLYIQVADHDIMVSNSEIEYRADLWKHLTDNN